jgi:hypothetical protein
MTGILMGMAAGVLLVGAIAWANTAPAPAASDLSMSAAELDSLSVYLTPSAPAPMLDQQAAFLPEARRLEPPAGPIDPGPEDLAVVAPLRSVSAILTGGGGALAIIDDVTVGPGALLPDGARVVSIDRESVVLRETDGTIRTLRLKAG